MQINSTTNTVYVNTIQKTEESTNINQTANTTFDILTLENKDPKEITYDEYKELTSEDIEQLFPKESMPEENEKAMALHRKVNISDDNILNQVLFDKELSSDDSKAVRSTLGMIDFLDEHWALATSFESFEKANKYMEDNDIPFSKEVFFKIQQKMESTINYEDDDSKMTAEELFEIFDNNKLGYEDLIDFHNYTPNDKEYQDFQEQIQYRESIKNAYEQKLNEQNATLDAYTRNNKKNTVLI